MAKGFHNCNPGVKRDPKFRGGRFRAYLEAVEQLSRLAGDRYSKSVLALAPDFMALRSQRRPAS